MQTNTDLRPVTRSQTVPDREKHLNGVTLEKKSNANGKRKLKAARVKSSTVPSFGNQNSDHAQSTTLSSGSNHSAGRNTVSSLSSELEESDDPLNALSRRIHIKTDAYSCMEIRDMLESLNCDMMQLAALMSDKLRFKHAYAKTLEGLADLHGAAKNVITKGMRSIIVQTIIQAEHKLFATSYKKFREINSLETVAQWRAATREITKYGPQSDATRKMEWFAPKESIERMFGDRIRELVELTIGVDRAIMEGAMAQDLHLFMPVHDDTYDPNMMVDINQSPNAVASDGKVAVSINIRLKPDEKLLDEGKPKDSEVAVSETKVLLKAKVVFDTVLGI
ncbi:hypothetical protein DFS33DRAFT_1376619 [Desarmillaria ectypa]|nr:hypothetical protein DFS33DRAFT_1376619 [Desarmillaria ectypa]